MSKLIKPELTRYVSERKVSQLFFGEDSVAPTGEYYMRGGICWPVMTTDDGIKGSALVIGQNIKDMTCYVFAETDFLVIDHIVDDGKIRFKGLSSWFNEQWSKYFCSKYFWNQEVETNKKFLLQTGRSPMIKPKPQFIEVDWQDPAQAIHTVFERDVTGKLIYSKEGKLFRALEEYNADKENILPPLHALMCALVGLDRYPWRSRGRDRR